MRLTVVPPSKRCHSFHLAILLSSLVSIFPTSAFALESHLQTGISYFNAQQLPRALAEFRLANSEKPNDALTNYYLGVTLAKSKQFQKALKHFESARQLAAPDSDVSRLAGAAMKAYGHEDSVVSRPAQSGSGQAESVSSGVTKSPSGQLIPSLSVDGGAGSGGNGLNQNYDPINNGFGHRRPTAQVWNAPTAGSTGASLTATKSVSHGGPSVSIGLSNGQGISHYSSSDPAASQALRLIGNQAQSGISNSLYGGNSGYRRPYDYGYSSQQRASALRTSADNLSSQLVHDHLTGSGVRLVPEGTSLHVRNYESFHSDDDDRANVVPLEAKSLSLKDFAQTKSSSLSPSASSQVGSKSLKNGQGN